MGDSITPIRNNLNIYKVPFNGRIGNSTSNPIGLDEKTEQKSELASKDYADATRAMAMAQILSGSDIKPKMTQNEYVDKLMKKGKIPNKDFYIKNLENTSNTYVLEVNKKGERIKEVHFFEDGNIGCKFYNPQNQKIYKALETLDGKLHISYNEVLTGEPLCDELYSPDGTLETNTFYKKTPKGETSVNGDYIISGIKIPSS